MAIKKYLGNLHVNLESKKTTSDRLSDFLTAFFGTSWFLIVNAAFFCIWITVNSGLVTGIPMFDPFPYGLLTMIVSLEAIFLSIIVLISQNRAGKNADLREELDLRINIKTEEEVTRMINMLDEIHDHLGLVPEDDEELRTMKKKTDVLKMRNDLVTEKKSR